MLNALQYAQDIIGFTYPGHTVARIEVISSFEVKLHCEKYIDEEETLLKVCTFTGLYAEEINKRIKHKQVLEEITALQNRIDWLKESIEE